MIRREFVRKGLAGVAALPLAGVRAISSPSKDIAVEGKLNGHEADWTFVGGKNWSQDEQGVLYSPIWNDRRAKREDLLKREDFAYPSSEALTDTDLRVELETFYWSVVTAGITFRAQDSGRFYVVEFFDIEPTASAYSVRLFVQDASGYRRDIASAFA